MLHSTPSSSSGSASPQVTGAIVVVAKCPIQGKSKTRLIPLLGEQGSVALAKAMLSDVLWTVEACPAFDKVQKILLYAPGNATGLTMMQGIFQELRLPFHPQQSSSSSPSFTVPDKNPNDGWTLLPMVEGDLNASDLGSKLEDALCRARQCMMLSMHEGQEGGVVFLGMDAPELGLDDIVMGLVNASTTATTTTTTTMSAMLCPADDGGYGMLCVPPNADPSRTFRNMYWSHSLTAVSQIKNLTDQNILVNIGKLMYDIDEPSDVEALCQRLKKDSHQDTKAYRKNLSFPHGDPKRNSVSSDHPNCHYTRSVLEEFQLLL
jgi:glycosyltransferase A (GT-A) superfamily protein (DUF2064 family)